MRKQEENEPVDAFITDLYALAEHCSYRMLHNEMIRDRLVVGLRDAKLSEKLQLDAELMLDKAVTQVRQAEAVKRQQTVLRSEGESLPVGNIQRGANNRPAKLKKKLWTQPAKDKSCSWCGRTPAHERGRCPAKVATCRKC